MTSSSDPGDVAGAEVVPPARRKRRIEHRLVREERLRHAEVEHRRPEVLERRDDALRPPRSGRHSTGRHRRPASRAAPAGLPGRSGARRSTTIVISSSGAAGDPVAVEAQHLRRLLHRPEDRPRNDSRPDRNCRPNSNSVTTPKLPPPPRMPRIDPRSRGRPASRTRRPPSPHRREAVVDREPVLAHQPARSRRRA